MWYVFYCCSFACPCSTKASCVPLCSIISWSFFWTSTLLLSNFLLISSIYMSASHLFVQICLAWSANLCSVTRKTPTSSHIFFILCLDFLFFWLTSYPTLNYNLVYCLFSFHSLFFWSVASWQPTEAESVTPCMPRAAPSQLVVPVLLTLSFLIPWFDISLYLRLCFMVSTNQCFYRDTISRKTVTQG